MLRITTRSNTVLKKRSVQSKGPKTKTNLEKVLNKMRYWFAHPVQNHVVLHYFLTTLAKSQGKVEQGVEGFGDTKC